MADFVGTTTFTSIDRDTGKLKVFNVKTGELMYEVQLSVGTVPEGPRREVVK